MEEGISSVKEGIGMEVFHEGISHHRYMMRYNNMYYVLVTYLKMQSSNLKRSRVDHLEFQVAFNKY